MEPKSQISVLLPFQNQRDEVEPTLTAIFEMETVSFELVIIDDGSTDGTDQAIQSLLDYYQHEQTFYFEHEAPAGRGSCLNEALQQAGSPLIWAPRSLQSIDEKKFQTAIRNLQNGHAPCLIQQLSMPRTLSEWAERIREGRLPDSGKMLWNLRHIPSHQRFFNPFLQRYHGVDWLLRLRMDTLEMAGSFYRPSDFETDEELTAAERQELIMALLRRPGTGTEERKTLTGLLLDLPAIEERPAPGSGKHDLLEEAMQLKLDGQLSAALECVEKLLDEEPANPEAKQLKIKLLERKRRFVEASELKHEMEAGSRRKRAHADIERNAIKTSLIIPTALYGKPALEHCLLSVDEHCNPASTELIIIDNASLDDTHEYLQELEAKNFFNLRIITNKKNNGFARSVNQGLEAANGQYACIIHNDVELDGPAITQLEQLMDRHPGYAVAGPLTNSTLNPDQLISNRELYDEEIVPTDYLDSFCMMLRTETAPGMDEAYTLAFFDDIDLSFEARKQGHKVGIVPGVQVTHHYGTTTFALDLDTESELYWKNIAHFNEKWDIQTYSEEELRSKSRFEQLLTLDEWVNPLYPEQAIKEKFEELFTDEMKTEILKSSHDDETLLRLVHLMMVMDRRDVMRRLEDRIGDMELPTIMAYEIIRFYFNRNVYSRCLHYLNRLSSQQESLQSDLYRLAILIDEKKMDEAIPLLTELLDRAPANPLLYKLAGDIHAFENNKREADSFYTLANQINPFDFTETQKEIQLNS